MAASPVPIVLAIDNEEFRQEVDAALQRLNNAPELIGVSNTIYSLTPAQRANALILLETKDDVALLVQLVNDLYRSPYHPGGMVWVICIASEQALQQNPRLGGWLIDGHAA